MSEIGISREDAIKKLNCHLKNKGYCECDKCDYDTDVSIVDTLNKAISDMQKLEKIEKYLGKMNNNKCDCCESTYPKCVEENITCAIGLYFNLINTIEQIVKE